ncbi:MAG: DNA double-strand break repair nuclease NurA, partial [Thermoproteus sp.]
MEDLEYWLEPELLSAVRYDVEANAKRLERLRGLAERITSIREKAEIKRLGGPPRDLYIYAIDSSYGSPPLELIGGVFTVIAYGYVGRTKQGIDKFLGGSLYFEDREEQDISRYTALLERRLAARLLRRKARGEKALDVLLIDGELAVHPLPFNLAAAGGRYEEANRAVDFMLAEAEATGTTLVGLAKRVRSRYLSVLYGGCLPVNDRAAASLALRPGEYMVLGRLKDLLPKWAEIHYAECEGGPLKDEVLACAKGGAQPGSGRSARLCERLKEFYKNFESVLSSDRYPHLKLLGEVAVAYYMPPGSQTAVRVEVLDLGPSLEETVSFLAATSSTVTGYPQILDEVDRYVRVSPELVESVLMMLIRKAPREVAGMLLPNNLQKYRRL